jgi:hypothetical protein
MKRLKTGPTTVDLKGVKHLALVILLVIVPAAGARSQRRSEPRDQAHASVILSVVLRPHPETYQLSVTGPATARVANGMQTAAFAGARRLAAPSRRATPVLQPGPVPAPALEGAKAKDKIE